MIVGFLGTGRIAAPMATALARGGHEVLVSERNRAVSSGLAARFDNVSVAVNRKVVERSEVVVLCLLAAVARKELPGLPFRPDHKVISVMADIGLEEIAGLTGPTDELCVTIPYPFIDSGGCPLAVYPESPALDRLFGPENVLIPLQSEEAVKPHFAATAVTSTLLKELVTARDWLREYTDGPAAAERYMLLLVSGYLNALPKDGRDRLREAIEDLATEGGLNAQLLGQMQDAGAMEALQSGLDALLKR